MPFIRHTRDKRGYESTMVLHAYRPDGHGANRARVLYLFRTPAQLRVGRRPLDEEIREALEHTHPDLRFDWVALDRAETVVVSEPAHRPHRAQRQTSSAPSPLPAPVVVIAVDESVLGKTLGAVDAARLRQRFQDVMQRIARRARTPEERDRLIDRAQRLNPDDWIDDAAIRAAVQKVEAEWDAILGELPARRRGRRGGAKPPTRSRPLCHNWGARRGRCHSIERSERAQWPD